MAQPDHVHPRVDTNVESASAAVTQPPMAQPDHVQPRVETRVMSWSAAVTHGLSELSIRDDPLSALDLQVKIASDFAAERPNDPVANEGAAAAVQEREIFADAAKDASDAPAEALQQRRAAASAHSPATPPNPGVGNSTGRRARAKQRASAASASASRAGSKPEGSPSAAAGAIHGSEPDDDELDNAWEMGGSEDDDDRSSATVRSDYGEDSSGEDTVVLDAVPPNNVRREVPQLAHENLFRMVAQGTLPERRFVIPNAVADVQECVTHILLYSSDC